MFRQDNRINKIFLTFSRSAGQAAERQKVLSVLEGSRSRIAPINSNTRGKAFIIVVSQDFLALKQNEVFTASSGRREINQVNPVNPVRKQFAFMSK
jgi:hypothetical protein